MNARAVLIMSLGVNLLLGAFVLKKAQRSVAPSAGPVATEAAVPATPEVREITQHVVVTNTLPAAETKWPRWSELESADWGEFRTNLLAVGCPGVTVREILGASLLRAQFAEQQSVVARINPVFWDELARHGFEAKEGPLATALQQLEDVNDRYDQLTQTVLEGLPRHRDAEDKLRDQRNHEQQFAHLAPALQQQAAELQRAYEQRRDELLQATRRPEGGTTPEGHATLQGLAREHEAAIAALIGPEAARERSVRLSGHADWAAALPGLQVSADEMRLIAGWKVEHSKTLSVDEAFLTRYGVSQSQDSVGRAAADQQLDDRLRNLLGTQRFADYQRAANSQFQSLQAIGDRFELSDQAVSQAWQLQQEAVAAAGQVRANAELTAVQRRDALRAIQQETRRSVESTLGADAFYTYQRHGGEWMQELSALNPAR